MNNYIKKRKMLLGFIAFISTYVLAKVLAEILFPVYSVVYLFLFIAEVRYIFHDGNQDIIAGSSLTGYLLCFLFSYFCLAGMFLSRGLNIGPRRLAMWFIASIGIAIIVYNLVYINGISLLKFWVKCKDEKNRISDRKFYIGCLCMMVIGWSPTWLAFYPGIWGYDVPVQMSEHMGTYTTHHPLLHTLLLQLFYHIGVFMHNPSAGVAAYTLIQMVILASALSYMLLYFRRCHINIIFIRVMQIIMIVFPLYSVHAITATKDVIFTAMFLYVITILAYIADEQYDICNVKKIILWSICLILCCLFRNNAGYAVILLFCMSMARYRKNREYRHFFEKTGIIVLMVYVICSQILMICTHAEKGSRNEMLSIPYQQIARVYNTQQDQLSDEEKNEVLKIIPDVRNYNPKIADFVKERATGLDYKKDFVSLYFSFMKEYPYQYCEAFLLNTMGYWFVDDISATQLYGVGAEDGRVGYFWMYIWQHMGVKHISYFPCLENIYLGLYGENTFTNIPIIYCFYNIAIYIWVILAAVVYSVQTHKKKYSLIYALELLLFCTYLLGPAACIRYALPFIFSIPLILVITFRGEA